VAKQSFRTFLTNLDQPMPLPEKLFKLTRNLWRRVILQQDCCGHDGEPGCWRVEHLSGSEKHEHHHPHSHK